MKPLKPSMRERKRYLLVTGKNLKENIEKAILDFIGVLGMSKASLNFIKTERDFAVISVNRDSVNHVRTSFCVWPEKMTIERVSGSLKGLRGK